MREAPESDRAALEHAARAVLDGLRRRLGSTFTVTELADLYGSSDADFAAEAAHAAGAESEAAWVADAAFNRYVREAVDFFGGRRRERSLEG
jgi:hypothetical protein